MKIFQLEIFPNCGGWYCALVFTSEYTTSTAGLSGLQVDQVSKEDNKQTFICTQNGWYALVLTSEYTTFTARLNGLKVDQVADAYAGGFLGFR